MPARTQERKRVLVKKKAPLVRPLSFLDPFSKNLWLALLGVACWLTLAFYAVDRLSYYGYRALPKSDDSHSNLNLGRSFVSSFGVLIGGDFDPGRSYSIKLMQLVYLFFVLIISATYTANLVAFLAWVMDLSVLGPLTMKHALNQVILEMVELGVVDGIVETFYRRVTQEGGQTELCAQDYSDHEMSVDPRTIAATLSTLEARREAELAEPGRNPLAATARTDVDKFAPAMQKRADEGSIMAQRWIDAHVLQAKAVKLFSSAPRITNLTAAQMDEGLAMLDQAHRTWDVMVWTASSADICHRVAVHRLRSSPQNRNALIQVARDSTNPREMVRLYTQLAHLFPKDPDVIFALGCMGGMGDPAEGVKLLRRAIDLDHGADPSRYFVLAGALRCSGRDKESITAFQKFLDLNPKDHRHVPESLYGIGFQWLMAGDLTKARQFYEAGLAAEDPSVRLPCLEPVMDHYEPKAVLRRRFPTARASSSTAGLHPLQSNLQQHGHEAARRVLDAHESSDSSQLPIEAMMDPTGAAARAHFLSLLKRTTDIEKNAADPLGDGDQMPRSSRGPKDPNQSLYDVWASGADFNPYSPTLGQSMSEFAKACYAGDLKRVQAAIAAAREADGAEPGSDDAAAAGPAASSSSASSSSSTSAAAPSSTPSRPAPGPALRDLLERRVSLLRLSPLLVTIAGARAVGRQQHPGGDSAGDWLGVCRLLVSQGARIWAVDVAGYGAIAHATSAMSTETSLEIARYLLESPLDGGCGMSANARNRGGKTALHDAVMSMRSDIVQLLCEFGDADPYATADGITPMTLARLFPQAMAAFNQQNRRKALMHPSAIVMLANPLAAGAGAGAVDAKAAGAPAVQYRCVRYLPRVSRMLVEPRSEPGATLEAAVSDLRLSDERDTSSQQDSPGSSPDLLCAAPGCDKYGSKQCVRCGSIRYCCRDCQMKHWKTHKKECAKLMQANLVKVPAGAGAGAGAAASSAASSSGAAVPSSLGVSLPAGARVVSIPWGSTAEHATDLGESAAADAAARRGAIHKKKGARVVQGAEEGAEPVSVANDKYQRAIVKVQVPQGAAGLELLVYDRSRSWQRLISSAHPQYKEIVRCIQTGPNPYKAYLWASITNDGAVAFSLAEQAPPQDW